MAISVNYDNLFNDRFTPGGAGVGDYFCRRAHDIPRNALPAAINSSSTDDYTLLRRTQLDVKQKHGWKRAGITFGSWLSIIVVGPILSKYCRAGLTGKKPARKKWVEVKDDKDRTLREMVGYSPMAREYCYFTAVKAPLAKNYGELTDQDFTTLREAITKHQKWQFTDNGIQWNVNRVHLPVLQIADQLRKQLARGADLSKAQFKFLLAAASIDLPFSRNTLFGPMVNEWGVAHGNSARGKLFTSLVAHYLQQNENNDADGMSQTFKYLQEVLKKWPAVSKATIAYKDYEKILTSRLQPSDSNLLTSDDN